MKRNLFFFSLLLSSIIFAQNHKPCGTTIMTKEALKNEPSLKRNIISLQKQMDSLKTLDVDFKSSNVIRTIPVVIHIMYSGQSSNISDAQVHDAMRIINEDFNKLNSDTVSIIDEFKPIIADAGIEFKLAKIDPEGNCTKGITRTFTLLTNDAGENVKDIIKWDPSSYLNVWVVSSIGIGAGGYSYYPGQAPNNDANAGVVILASQFGSIGASNGNNSSNRSLTHEIGHYLGLNHTWGDSNENNVQSNCNWDDGIADTPETIGTDGTCNLAQTTCFSLDNVQNFMDYASCPKMYTEGQKNAMRQALLVGNSWHNAPRNNLWKQSNLIATGLLDNNNNNDCKAIVDFEPQSKISCTAEEVEWRDLSYNFDSVVSYEWSFEGGNPSTSTERNPMVNYNEAGLFDVSLTVTTSGGTETKTMENAIQIHNSSDLITAPGYINFESNEFPINSNNSNENWYLESDDDEFNWEWNEASSTNENGSLRIRSKYSSGSYQRNIYSPIFDLSNVSSPCNMYFDYAYAKRNANSNDLLRIKVSDNCGSTWMTRLSKDSENLTTVNSNYSLTFTPTSNQWETQKVNINPWAGESHLQFKMEFSGVEGNYLYIDNIRFGVPNLSVNELIAKTLDLNVAPNPNNGNALITFNMLQPQTINFHLVDLLGNTIISYQDEFNTGQHKINLANLNSEIKPGLYFLKCTIGDYSETQQVIVH
jgi:PKD repeat protein